MWKVEKKYVIIHLKSMCTGKTEKAVVQLWEYHQHCLLSRSKLWCAGSRHCSVQAGKRQSHRCVWVSLHQGLVPCVLPLALFLVPLYVSFSLSHPVRDITSRAPTATLLRGASMFLHEYFSILYS